MKKLAVLLALMLFTVIYYGCKKQMDEAPKESQPDNSIAAIDTNLNLSATLASTSTDFALGVNGHPFNSPAYLNTPVSRQISFLKSMALKYYRFDIIVHSDGSVGNPSLLNELMIAASQQNITLIPTVSASVNYQSSTNSNYSSGYNFGKNFAQHYSKNFTYYGLGNELDNKAIHSNSSGQSKSNYDLTKIKLIASYLKGLDAGIKSVDPTAKTMVDESFLHYAFLELMEDYGVNFDIVACHWYADMEGVAAKSPYNIPDITVKLSSIFKKPIWFTEVNKRYRNDVSRFEYEQDLFFKSFIAKCKRNKQVKSILIYELLDEPSRSNSEEAHFGLIKWTNPYTSWQYRLAAKNLMVK